MNARTNHNMGAITSYVTWTMRQRKRRKLMGSLVHGRRWATTRRRRRRARGRGVLVLPRLREEIIKEGGKVKLQTIRKDVTCVLVS
jgi:hypothetical protein